MTTFNSSIPPEVLEILKEIVKHFNFGFVENCAEITLSGRQGLLVWDYVIWNELTFVDLGTNQQQSLFTSMSDSDTRAKFNYYVSQSEK